MERWTAVRLQARGVLTEYERLGSQPAFTAEAGSHTRLEDIAKRVYDLSVFPDTELGEGVSGALDLDNRLIGYRPEELRTRQRFTIAHEIGHRALEHPAREFTDRAEDIDEEPDHAVLTVRDGVYRAYSSRDRLELEANIFAAELLAPVDRVRTMALADADWTVDGLGQYFGLSRAAMLNQLVAALLPGPEEDAPALQPAHGLLDEAQQQASTIRAPALVVAGPGSGKTRVLVERFARLVRQGTPPDRILALTFGNKAAEEMRERIAAILPEHAHAIQVGTFHSLGLDLLVGYGQYLGWRPDPQLLTDVDALVFLRRRLGELPLGSFEEVRSPTRHVPRLLDAISRAKDELVDPAEYEALVAAWWAELDGRSASGSDDQEFDREREAAAACRDIAAVYATYQSWLREGNFLDYGDLIAEAVRLFDVPEVAEEIRSRYDHILVDELQDANYAASRLIAALDGGRGLVWAVGDPRQSVYRFRGASPAGLRNFVADYAGAEIIALDSNYRSVEGVVAAGQAVPIPAAASIDLPMPRLQARRGPAGDPPSVEVIVASTVADERAAIVARVNDLLAQDIPADDIAVLCRVNSHAQALAEVLEAGGIATDWGGEIEERPEFKDLIGVLYLVADDPRGLVRVARMADHRLTEADLRLLQKTARDQSRSLRAALREARDGNVAGISAEGRERASRPVC